MEIIYIQNQYDDVTNYILQKNIRQLYKNMYYILKNGKILVWNYILYSLKNLLNEFNKKYTTIKNAISCKMKTACIYSKSLH